MVVVRLNLRRPIVPTTRALFGSLGLLVLLGSGCTKVCEDDGWAWQQDPACLAQLTQSTSDSETDDDTAGPTGTETETPTMGGEGKTYCIDGDGDGFGDKTMCTDVPPGDEPPPGSVDNDADCDDADDHTFPGAAPNDDPDACMTDADEDDWGDLDPPNGGEGGPEPGSDCDDHSAGTFPGAAPNDSPTECMKDEDGDDWGDADPPGEPDGPIEPGSDCDDADTGNHDMCGPVCVDEDSDGYCAGCGNTCPGDHPDEDCDDADDHTFPGAAPLDDPNACMTDEDEDDYGDDTPSNPEAEPGTDCDDSDGAAFPGSAPLDSADACMKDGDGDDHGDGDPENPDVTPGNDCNDDHDGINPTDSLLITAAINSGEILEVDVDTGALTAIDTLDTTGFNPWIPTSVAIHPNDRTVFASLAFKSSLVTMNYCGAGTPTALPKPHKKNLCAIGFDADGALWGVDGQVDELILFADDGSVATAVDLTYNGVGIDIAECGMTWDCHKSRMLVSDTASGAIYEVNTVNAALTMVAEVPDADFGSGLAYEPVSKRALSCFGQSFYAIAIDGSNDFTQLSDLAAEADDLEYAPACN